jgi:hypothetical protein
MVADDRIFEPIHRVVLRENLICGGDEMVVYALHWDELETRDGRADAAGAGEGSSAGVRRGSR